MDTDPFECPVCCSVGEISDGPTNSDIPTICPHYLCIYCWQEIYLNSVDDESYAKCPLCRIDVSEWLMSHYPLNTSDDEDSDYESEHEGSDYESEDSDRENEGEDSEDENNNECENEYDNSEEFTEQRIVLLD